MNAIDMPWRRPVVPAAARFAVEVHAGDGLAAADWPSIAAPYDLAMYAFQSREFLHVWMATIGKARGSECYFVVVKDAGRPILYLPLAIERVFRVRLLRFLDAGVTDYNAPILHCGRDLTRREFQALWREILSRLPRIDAIDLQKMPHDVAGRLNPLTFLDCVPYMSSGHSIVLAALRSEVDARPKVRAQRKNLQRRARALNAVGKVEFVDNPAAAARETVLSRLLELKRQKYMRTIGRDFLATPGVAGFYREIAAPERLGRISHLAAILCNGEVVSGHLGFIGRGRFHYILPAYEARFRRFEVGHLLLQHLIDQSAAQGVATFDLGVGDFPYKARWATHRLVLGCHQRALSVAGWVFFRLRGARHLAASTGIRRWLRAVTAR